MSQHARQSPLRRNVPLSVWPLILWIPFMFWKSSYLPLYSGMPKRFLMDSITMLSDGAPLALTIVVAAIELWGWKRRSLVFKILSAIAVLLASWPLVYVVRLWYLRVWLHPHGTW
jgi:hypothetical protein